MDVLLPYEDVSLDQLCALYGVPQVPEDASEEEFERIVGVGSRFVKDAIKQRRWGVPPESIAGKWAYLFMERQLLGELPTPWLREEFKQGVSNTYLLVEHLDYVYEIKQRQKGIVEPITPLQIIQCSLRLDEAEAGLLGEGSLLGENLWAHWRREGETRALPFVVVFCRILKSDRWHVVGGITEFVQGGWVVRVIDSSNNCLPFIEKHIREFMSSMGEESFPISFDHRIIPIQGDLMDTPATLYGCNGFAYNWAHELAHGIPFADLQAPSDLRFIHLRLVTLEKDDVRPVGNYCPCFHEAHLYHILPTDTLAPFRFTRFTDLLPLHSSPPSLPFPVAAAATIAPPVVAALGLGARPPPPPPPPPSPSRALPLFAATIAPPVVAALGLGARPSPPPPPPSRALPFVAATIAPRTVAVLLPPVPLPLPVAPTVSLGGQSPCPGERGRPSWRMRRWLCEKEGRGIFQPSPQTFLLRGNVPHPSDCTCRPGHWSNPDFLSPCRKQIYCYKKRKRASWR